ncbi:MAG: hypothetical protein QXO17_01610 [Nitrososphaerota archaeon]
MDVIVETHGEVCRLGYLRAITAIAASLGEGTTLEYIAAMLHSLVQSTPLVDQSEEKLTGFIRNPVTARNYVTLARDLGFVGGERTGGLGTWGRIYMAMKSSAKFSAYVRGDVKLSHRDLISLNPVEKFLMLYVVLQRDHLMTKRLLEFAIERGEFTRNEAMIFLMEEVYPEVLRTLMSSAGKRRRAELMQKLEEAQRFRELRESFGRKSEWIRSPLYAKYRHVAPPRLEWLVDLDLLAKVRRGRYAVSELLRNNSSIFRKVLGFPPSSLPDQLFANIAPVYLKYVKSPPRGMSLQALLTAFRQLSRDGREPVNVKTLEVATSFLLLENNLLMTPKEAHEFLNGLSLIHSDKIFMTPMEDGLYITRIALRETDLTT